MIKKGEEYNISRFSPYVDYMVEAKKRDIKFKKPASTEQAPSTQAILSRPKEKDLEWQSRPLPPESLWKAKADAKNLDEATGMDTRKTTLDEIVKYEEHRRGTKNELGDQEDATLSVEMKQKAVDAFMFSPGTNPLGLSQLEIQRLARLAGYETKPIPQEPPKIKKDPLFKLPQFGSYGDIIYGSIILISFIWAFIKIRSR